jgi:hypothetical protein
LEATLRLLLLALLFFGLRAQAHDATQHLAIVNESLSTIYGVLKSKNIPLINQTLANKSLFLKLNKNSLIKNQLSQAHAKFIGIKPWVAAGAYEVAKVRAHDKATLNVELLKLYPNLAGVFDQLAAEAMLTVMTQMGRSFGGPKDCYVADAFRHTYWSALNAKYHGQSVALTIVMGHEIKRTPTGWAVPPNDGNSLMDVHNDLVGISIGTKFRNKSDGFIRAEILRLVNSGQLIMLDPYITAGQPASRGLTPTLPDHLFSRTPIYNQNCYDPDVK